MVRLATYRGEAYTWSSTGILNSRPNWFTFTLDVLSVVSLKLAPVRWLSLCWVNTLTWADAHMFASNINSTKLKKSTHFRGCVIFIVSSLLLRISLLSTRASCREAWKILHLRPRGVKLHWVDLRL